jgi:ABC-2 type transport system permease protein
VTGWWWGTRLVIGRELLVGFRRKSYRITLAVLFLGGVGVAVVPRLLSSDETPKYELAVVGAAPSGFEAALDAVGKVLELRVETEMFPDRAAAEAAVADDDVDAGLVWPPGAAEGEDREPPVLLQEPRTAAALLAAVSNAAVASSTTQRLEAAGVAPERAPTVLAAPPRVETVETPATTGREGVGFAVVLFLYVAIITAGGQVATGVAVEKTNRIAEALLATVRASQLLAGKVVGIGVLSLIALLVVAVPAAVATATAGDLDIDPGAAGQIAAGVGWFVLGYGIYGCVYAALGALVDRQEEVNGAVSPITMALVGTYLLAVQAQSAPDSLLAVVTSLFPLTAPVVMPMRLAVTRVSLLELAVAVVGIVAGAAVLVRVGGTVYRRAIIRTGRRLKLRDVLRG